MKIKKPSGAILSYEDGKYSSAAFDEWFREHIAPLNELNKLLTLELSILYAAIEPDNISEKGRGMWHEALKMKLEREKI